MLQKLQKLVWKSLHDKCLYNLRYRHDKIYTKKVRDLMLLHVTFLRKKKCIDEQKWYGEYEYFFCGIYFLIVLDKFQT